MNRLMAYSGLRPIKVKVEVTRYAWVPQPLYRARIVQEALAKREQPKKRPASY